MSLALIELMIVRKRPLRLLRRAYQRQMFIPKVKSVSDKDP